MIKNYIITAINNLPHNKLFSAINITGFSLALVGIISIALYVRNELSYDRWLPDSDRIVRLHTTYIMEAYLPAPTLLNFFQRRQQS